MVVKKTAQEQPEERHAEHAANTAMPMASRISLPAPSR